MGPRETGIETETTTETKTETERKDEGQEEEEGQESGVCCHTGTNIDISRFIHSLLTIK